MTHTLSNPKTWLTSYGDYLYRFAYFRVSDTRVSEDLVQETFLQGISSRENFKGLSTEKTWLTSILKHLIFAHYRKDAKVISLSQLLPEAEQEIDSLFDETNHWITPPQEWNIEKDIDNRKLAQQIHFCLQKLPPLQREIYTLKEIEQESSSQICQEYSLSKSNLFTSLHRVRTKLRNCLSKHWFSQGDIT